MPCLAMAEKPMSWRAQPPMENKDQKEAFKGDSMGKESDPKEGEKMKDAKKAEMKWKQPDSLKGDPK